MLSPLDHKLLRDLWRMKLQGFAIALVIALGVMMQVMMGGLVNSLQETKRAYYERYRLADVFAPVKRAPEHVLDEIAELDGVAAVEGRVIGGALVNLDGVDVPVRALAASLPETGEPRLNDIFLTAGRRMDPTRRDEIVLLKGFANAHDLGPGDTLSTTMNGARRRFEIVGLAEAPEFIYSTPPGELVPDDSRFAVMWMNEEALQAAFDVDGAFNEALVKLARGARPDEILASLDRILEPYGGTGAYDLEDQFSNRFVSEEINQLRVSSATVPPVFLAVAAFLLYIVISRMVQAEREEIGLLKAFGYSSLEVGFHYFRFIMAIAIGGALLGCLFGVMAGRGLAAMYVNYYKFPFLVFQVDPAAFFTGVTTSILAASAGGVVVLRRVFALTPAVAMRPPAPADYSRSVKFGPMLKALLDQPSRMVARRLLRHPLRAFAAILGIGAGMSLSVAMMSVLGAFERTLDISFTVIDRSDVTVSFIEPFADKTIYELQRIPGVIEVEPFRAVPAILRNGLHTYRSDVSGMVGVPRLNRAVDEALETIYIREDGAVLSRSLAEELRMAPGDTLIVEVREGRRPVLEVPVVGVAETLLGASAYMEIEALNEALREPGRVSGAHLRIDQAQRADVYRQLKDMPAVAGVSIREEARASFQRIMDSGAGGMRYIWAAVAAIITFGIVYNSARIAFSERARDLASLRVLGFTRGEAAFVLLGELAVITLLALPVGVLLGRWLLGLFSDAFSTDLYRIPVSLEPTAMGQAVLAVLLSALVSGWLVKRDLDRVDLVSALKTKE